MRQRGKSQKLRKKILQVLPGNVRRLAKQFKLAPSTIRYHLKLLVSMGFVESVEIIKNIDYIISNIDTTVCLEKPKIKDHIPDIQSSLATNIGIDKDCISVKATTTEKLGIIGKEEAIAAYATILIYKPY